jgi:polysaccharide export outer membrane protein
LRPWWYFSSQLVFSLLLAVPFAYSQQQKPSSTPVAPVAPSTTSKPMSVVASETNERIAQLAQASDVTQGDYVIGSADLLGIEVFDVPELSREVRVNETGYISLPLMPTRVRARGLTTFQLQDKIAELLQTNGLVSAPQVNISLKEQHSQPITVIGSVRNPLIIQAQRQTTLLQALSQAGGISDEAGSTIIVTRTAQTLPAPADPSDASTPLAPQAFTIDLADLLNSGDPRFNIPLVGGDVVSVPRAGIIYVVGAVTRPGAFLLQNDLDHMTMLKMLSLAGGATNTAKTKSAVILRKNPDTGKRDQIPVDLRKVLHLKIQDVQLQSNDILFVPDSNGLRALHRAGDVGVALTEGLGFIAAGKI